MLATRLDAKTHPKTRRQSVALIPQEIGQLPQGQRRGAVGQLTGAFMEFGQDENFSFTDDIQEELRNQYYYKNGPAGKRQ